MVFAQNFLQVMVTYKGHLLLSEGRWGDDSSWRWWGYLTLFCIIKLVWTVWTKRWWGAKKLNCALRLMLGSIHSTVLLLVRLLTLPQMYKGWWPLFWIIFLISPSILGGDKIKFLALGICPGCLVQFPFAS